MNDPILDGEYHFREFMIRRDMLEALWRYIDKGIPTGDFLRAILAHDLMEACNRADHWNLPNLPAYAAYLYNEVPSVCHGSYEKVDAWIAHSGLLRPESEN